MNHNQLGFIAQWNSGLPFNIRSNRDLNLDGVQNDRPIGIDRNTVHFFEPFGVKVPIAVSCFPDELYPVPRSWAERAYPNLIHYNRLPKGGHFAAFEQPELLTQELRAGFRSIR